MEFGSFKCCVGTRAQHGNMKEARVILFSYRADTKLTMAVSH